MQEDAQLAAGKKRGKEKERQKRKEEEKQPLSGWVGGQGRGGGEGGRGSRILFTERNAVGGGSARASPIDFYF